MKKCVPSQWERNASLRPAAQWDAAGYRRTTWVTAQSVGAPFLIGFPVALVYRFAVRPRLEP